MANEIRERVNFVGGITIDDPLLATATILNSYALARLPVIDATNHAIIVLNDDGANNLAPEIVYVTEHAADAISATILRGQEGTVATQYPVGTSWTHGPVVSDFADPPPQESDRILHVQEVLAGHAGATTGGVWFTRTLNTVKTNEIIGASLASSTVTLPAGTYFAEGRSPSMRTGSSRIRLLNVTNNTSIIDGTSCYSDPTYGGAFYSEIRGKFTLAAESQIRVEQKTSNTNSNTWSRGHTAPEAPFIYTELIITQLKEAA